MRVKKVAEENLNKNLIKFNMEAKLYTLYEVSGGVVSIYKVTVEDDLPYEQFYLVTYDNGVNETPFGVGPTPWAALEYAALAWDLPQDGKPNPFRQVLASSS